MHLCHFLIHLVMKMFISFSTYPPVFALFEYSSGSSIREITISAVKTMFLKLSGTALVHTGMCIYF